MRRRRPERAGIEANLTSLIDVTFLLIVFFVLVSRLNEIEMIDMDLPNPANAASASVESENQVVVNVLPGPGGTAAGYRVGTADFSSDEDGLKAMAARLADLYKSNPRLDVQLRADRMTNYDAVEPVMRVMTSAARAAGATNLARVNLAVTADERGSRSRSR